MAETPKKRSPLETALYRIDLSVGENGTTDAQCDCGMFIRSTSSVINLLDLVADALKHRHECGVQNET